MGNYYYHYNAPHGGDIEHGGGGYVNTCHESFESMGIGNSVGDSALCWRIIKNLYTKRPLEFWFLLGFRVCPLCTVLVSHE